MPCLQSERPRLGTDRRGGGESLAAGPSKVVVVSRVIRSEECRHSRVPVVVSRAAAVMPAAIGPGVLPSVVAAVSRRHCIGIGPLETSSAPSGPSGSIAFGDARRGNLDTPARQRPQKSDRSSWLE